MATDRTAQDRALAEAETIAVQAVTNAGYSPDPAREPLVTRAGRAGLRAYDLGTERWFNEEVRGGRVGFCVHAPAVTQLYWFLVPGCPVACQACVAAWLQTAIGGTDDDTACDVCGRGPNAPGTFQQRHLVCQVLDPPDLTGQAITICYYVCRACADAEPASLP
jgi:hypothetical protein